jgi:hypothetical protein
MGSLARFRPVPRTAAVLATLTYVRLDLRRGSCVISCGVMRFGGLLACAACSVACGGNGEGDAGDGAGWSAAPGAPALMAAVDVWAFSTTEVWVLDGGPNVHRFDGETWSVLETPAAGLSCIFALSVSDVFLCAGTEVLHYDGAEFTGSDITAGTGLDGVSDVWAASRSDVWVVGDDAIIGHYDGTAWQGTIAGSPFKTSIWGSSPTDIYALDTFDLVHFDGSTWSEVPLDSGGGDGQVWGTGASDVWVMTDSSDLSHFDGASWQTVETDLVGDLAAVWGPASDDLWAAGSAGSIARYDGQAWREVTHQQIGAPYLRMFVALHGTSSTDVWAVGQELGSNGSTALIYHRAP